MEIASSAYNNVKGLLRASEAIHKRDAAKTVFLMNVPFRMVDLNATKTGLLIDMGTKKAVQVRQLPVEIYPWEIDSTDANPSFQVLTPQDLITRNYINKETDLTGVPAFIRINWADRNIGTGRPESVVMTTGLLGTSETHSACEKFGSEQTDYTLLTEPLLVFELLPDFHPAGKGRTYSEAQMALFARCRNVDISVIREELRIIEKGRANMTDRTFAIAMTESYALQVLTPVL